MDRRTALRQLSVIMGGLAIAPEMLASAVTRSASGQKPVNISAELLEILAEITEVIIPTTDTPGAKAAGVPAFIGLILEDCTAPDQQTFFWNGVEATEKSCIELNGQSFLKCTAEQRIAVLTQLQAESKTTNGPRFWPMLKGLTMFGYFSSEIGMTQALAFDPIPGEWIPEFTIDENTKAWAPMF